MSQIYKVGSKVIVNRGFMGGREGKIFDYDRNDNTYRVNFSDLAGDYHWFNEGEFDLLVSPKTHWDFQPKADFYFSNSRCFNHSWVLDYSSPFVKKDYFSCSKCKMKKEEFEQIEDDGVPF